MKILCDTSLLVEIDRGNEEVAAFLKSLAHEGHELIISTVTVAEILTGSYLSNAKDAVIKAKEVLNQFIWEDASGATAEAAAKIYAYLIIEKKHTSIEYQDVLIGATCISTNSDKLLTLNKKDFIILPQLKDKVRTPRELEEEI